MTTRAESVDALVHPRELLQPGSATPQAALLP